MKKGIFWIALSLFLVITLLAYLFDHQIMRAIVSGRTNSLDYFFLGIAFSSSTFIIFFFLMALFLWKEYKRRWVFPLILTSFLSFALSFILKVWIKRLRPFQEESILVLGVLFNFIKNNFNTWNFSFPNFQAVLVFSALPILNREFRSLRYVWVILAGLIAFSGVYFGAHYLSDSLAGAIIGYLIGLAMLKLEVKYSPGKRLISALKLSN